METAIVSTDGRVIIPNEVVKELGLTVGDKVCFVKRNGDWVIKPNFKDSLKAIQDIMKGEAEKAGWKTEEDITEYMKEIRKEYVAEKYGIK